MSRFRRFEIIEEEPLPLFYSPSPSSSHFFITETLPLFPSFLEQSPPFDLDLDLDLCLLPSPFLRVNHTRALKQQQLGLQSLSDRVAELESRIEQIVVGGGKGKKKKEKKKTDSVGRKYTWTAEIKDAEKNGFDRKYKWIAELVEEEKKKSRVLKNVKWTAEIKGKGEDRKYTFAVESGSDDEKKKKKNVNEKEKVKEKEKERKLRIVEIEEPDDDHKVVVLRQVLYMIFFIFYSLNQIYFIYLQK